VTALGERWHVQMRENVCLLSDLVSLFALFSSIDAYSQENFVLLNTVSKHELHWSLWHPLV
jgi:hypothetical protein